MNQPSIRILSRIVLALCGLSMFVVLVVPMWRIDLVAPQYPEGLYMLIYPHKVGGDVEIINGLNHYIGMKTIHTEDFKEFIVLPWIIGGFGVAFLLSAIFGKRWLLQTVTALFVLFGIVAMVDFWKWEYDYGHNLDPNAAIVVPGMAYQPPLIGFKQLLNFGAYSMPDIGGWIFVTVGILLVLMVWQEWRSKKTVSKMGNLLSLGLILFSLAGCSTKPSPIRLGKDQCAHCRMTLTHPGFGAEMVSKKGKTYFFDDTRCLKDYLQKEHIDAANFGEIYLTDFCKPHALHPGNQSFILDSPEINSPMGGHIAAFSNSDSAQIYARNTKGRLISWDELLAQ